MIFYAVVVKSCVHCLFPSPRPQPSHIVPSGTTRCSLCVFIWLGEIVFPSEPYIWTSYVYQYIWLAEPQIVPLALGKSIYYLKIKVKFAS